MEFFSFVLALIAILGALLVLVGVNIVPQSHEYVVERLGKYDRTLKAGFNFIFPILNRVAHKVEVLERQISRELDKISVITKDNVEIHLLATVFYRVTDPAKSVYRIQDLPLAIKNAVVSNVRSTCGQMEFDEIQSQREVINDRICRSLLAACEVWGVEITRTEILDVEVDEATKRSMQLQLNAERERRATVTTAEGNRDSLKLTADAEYYMAQKRADARRVLADAEAYATTKVAEAIQNNGQSAIDFELAKLQVQGLTEIAKSNGSKLIVIPTDISKSFGTLTTALEAIKAIKQQG
jgi:regulator of protease activity HflC (stomatin/prohibitin superfamily)